MEELELKHGNLVCERIREEKEVMERKPEIQYRESQLKEMQEQLQTQTNHIIEEIKSLKERLSHSDASPQGGSSTPLANQEVGSNEALPGLVEDEASYEDGESCEDRASCKDGVIVSCQDGASHESSEHGPRLTESK